MPEAPLENSLEASINRNLQQALSPEVLEVLNESHMHSGPATESHFRLTIVSDRFTGLSAVKRHQLVYATLAGELAAGVHALALHTFSPAEWNSRANAVTPSPNCLGGSKRDLE
jgi:BolA family transcriptional regulator, general stress-responsive regulator